MAIGTISNGDSGSSCRTKINAAFTILDAGVVGGSTGSTDNAILRADGTGGVTAQTSLAVVNDAGNVCAAGGAFNVACVRVNDPAFNTGMGSGSADLIQFMTENSAGPFVLMNGTGRMVTLGSDINLTWASGTNVGNNGSPDTAFTRDAVGVIAQKFTGTQQKFRIYNDTTSSFVEITHDGSSATIRVNSGDLHITNLPTSNPGPGILWNNLGIPAIGT